MCIRDRGNITATINMNFYTDAVTTQGQLEAPIKPDVNDINAPSAKEIAPFVRPKDVTWDPEDQAKFDQFLFMDPELHFWT